MRAVVGVFLLFGLIGPASAQAADPLCRDADKTYRMMTEALHSYDEVMQGNFLSHWERTQTEITNLMASGKPSDRAVVAEKRKNLATTLGAIAAAALDVLHYTARMGLARKECHELRDLRGDVFDFAAMDSFFENEINQAARILDRALQEFERLSESHDPAMTRSKVFRIQAKEVSLRILTIIPGMFGGVGGFALAIQLFDSSAASIPAGYLGLLLGLMGSNELISDYMFSDFIKSDYAAAALAFIDELDFHSVVLREMKLRKQGVPAVLETLLLARSRALETFACEDVFLPGLNR